MTVPLESDLRTAQTASPCIDPFDPPEVPPVCVCDQPVAGWMNECGSCRRPHGPLFAKVRRAWREHLGMAA